MTNVPPPVQPQRSPESSGEWLKTLTTSVTALVAVSALVLSTWQFFETRGDANREPFLQKQMDFAFKASEAVSLLATTDDLATFERARSDFWMLYWGPLSIVENQDVLDAMVDLGRIVPPHPVTGPQVPAISGLKQKSFKLALLMRQLMLDSWHADLPNLETPH